MKKFAAGFQKAEFEYRIFVSFGLVAAVVIVSFTVFAAVPSPAGIIGRFAGLGGRVSAALGLTGAAAACLAASLLRMWAGSVLSSSRMMSFKIRSETLLSSGPYRIVRNPIYLADLIAVAGFSLVLPLFGLFLPVLLYFHYLQLIAYEEKSLRIEHGPAFEAYRKTASRLLPDAAGWKRSPAALGEFRLNGDGIRHNALYVLLIPGFIVAAVTGKFIWAVLIGLPAVIDWAVVHTLIGTSPGGRPARPPKVFRDVLYANCWEDPAIDREAFRIGPQDVVFSITSGGCNVLTFLLDDPRRVIACDLNPAQNRLLELKMAAFRILSHDELLAFLGVREGRDRLALYRSFRPLLSEAARRFWDDRRRMIRKGVLHGGRYERYMRLLRMFVVNLSGKKPLVRSFGAAPDRAARTRLFRTRWDNFAWKALTGIFLSRKLNTLLFDGAFFAYLEADFSFGRHFAAKAERALIETRLRDNYFLSYILTGRFPEGEHLPPYLQPQNFSKIRARLDRMQIVDGDCGRYLDSVPESSISKFNFSNIFEWMSHPDFEDLLRRTVRAARDGAVLVYRNLLVHREHPASLDECLRSRRVWARDLHHKDLSFIYDNYVIEEVEKKGRA